MVVSNQQYRDRLFHFIFGSEAHRDWTLSLYNAVNNSDYSEPEAVQITTIEDILYLGMRNDVSFLIANNMNLYEQQSTFNPNMPLRSLQYLANLYDKYITANDLNKYSSRQLRLPVPKLLVFYNGPDEFPDEQFLYLRDAFPEGSSPDVEVRTRMLNINAGHNQELMKRCQPLREYSWITDTIFNYRKIMDLDSAVDKALHDMPDDFLLKPILRIHQVEVKSMLLTEYDEERQRMLDRKDGLEEGIEIGRREGIETGRREGIETGRREGIIFGAIEAMLDLGIEDNKIIEHIAARYNISGEEVSLLLSEKNTTSESS